MCHLCYELIIFHLFSVLGRPAIEAIGIYYYAIYIRKEKRIDEKNGEKIFLLSYGFSLAIIMYERIVL